MWLPPVRTPWGFVAVPSVMLTVFWLLNVAHSPGSSRCPLQDISCYVIGRSMHSWEDRS